MLCHRTLTLSKPLECYKESCALWSVKGGACSDTVQASSLSDLSHSLESIASSIDGIGRVLGDITVIAEGFKKKKDIRR
jgi:hypothetical protein